MDLVNNFDPGSTSMDNSCGAVYIGDLTFVSYDTKSENRIARLTPEPRSPKATPTLAAYGEWQTGYDFFNKELFNSRLPECVIVLRRKSKRNLGYFAPGRYANEDGEIIDELSMNPMHFRRGAIETLATLVHEMCHVWIEHFGKTKSRNGYHSKEWGALMESIGLMPSDTGEPGGGRTGQQMTHYIIAGGSFEITAGRLLDEKFQISWADADAAPDSLKSTKRINRNKSKYVCNVCRAAVWGKPALHITCGKCKSRFAEG